MVGKRNQDLRIVRTQKLLWDALVRLCSKLDFNDITIQQICDEALVHRTTFYAHYEDKYDLLRRGLLDMFAENSADIDSPKLVAAKILSGRHPTHLIAAFSHFGKYRAFYKPILCGPGSNPFRNVIKSFLIEQGIIRASLFRHTGTPGTREAVMSHFAAGALLSVLAWWLEDGTDISPEVAAQYFTDLLFHGCQSFPRDQHPLARQSV